jgi:hypothetical protein
VNAADMFELLDTRLIWAATFAYIIGPISTGNSSAFCIGAATVVHAVPLPPGVVLHLKSLISSRLCNICTAMPLLYMLHLTSSHHLHCHALAVHATSDIISSSAQLCPCCTCYI